MNTVARARTTDVGEYVFAVPDGLMAWYDQKYANEKKKSHAHVKWLFLYFMAHYCCHFFFAAVWVRAARSSRRSVDAVCVTLGTQKNDYLFSAVAFLISGEFGHTIYDESRSKIASNIDRNVLFYFVRNLIMLRKTRSAGHSHTHDAHTATDVPWMPLWDFVSCGRHKKKLRKTDWAPPLFFAFHLFERKVVVRQTTTTN